MVNAVIFVRPDKYGVNAARCLEYCHARRYNVVGVIPGDWPAAMQMLGDGSASVIVVAAPDQQDPLREPRIEVVGETRPPPAHPERFPARTGPLAARPPIRRYCRQP